MRSVHIPVLALVLALSAAPAAAQHWKPGGTLKAADKQRDEIKKELAPKAKQGDLEAARKLVDYLSYRHQYPRADAFDALCDVKDEKVRRWLAAEALFDGNPDVRADVIEIFEVTRDKLVLPYLEKLLARDAENRQLILWVIGELGGAEQAEAVAGVAKKDREPRARAEAIETLARLDREAAKPLARAGAVGDDWEVRVGSLRALSEIDEDGAFDGALANLRERRAALEKKKKARWQPAFMSMKVLLGLREREKRVEGLREAIDILIALLEKGKGESGRMKHEVLQALRALTGKMDIDDHLGWETWWEVNRERYAPKDAPGAGRDGEGGEKDGKGRKGAKGRKGKRGGDDEPPPSNGGGAPAGGEPEAVGTTVRFHGIPIWSDRVAFVIDASGSMDYAIPVKEPEEQGPSGTTEREKKPKGPTERKKIDLSKEELTRTVNALPDEIMFNIVVFGTEAKAWQKHLVQAAAQVKSAATSWIKGIKIEGRTNYFMAIEEPLEDPLVDTVYFLTDGGMTTEGRYIDQDRIIRRLWDVNKYALVEVNCILFGAEDQTRIGSDRRWMEAICNRTGGKFYVKP